MDHVPAAHQQCARAADSLNPEEGNEILTAERKKLKFNRSDRPADLRDWRCLNCVQDGIEVGQDASSSLLARRASAPKLTRDLFPTQSTSSKPGSHSVFNALILDDDPMDGSRSLRKRKASDAEDEGLSLQDFRKRQRRMTSEVDVKRRTATPEPAGREPSKRISTVERRVQLDGQDGASPRPRPSRVRSLRQPEKKQLVDIRPRDPHKGLGLVVVIHCNPEKLADLDNEKRRRRRRERERERRAMISARARQAQPAVEASHYPALQPSSFALQALAFQERDGDELKMKPYGGILSEAEADTSKTFPQPIDRKKFEDARQKAEDEWRKKMQLVAASETGRANQASLKAGGPPTKIKCINFAGYEIDTWHAAPYPEEYSRNRVLYICEFCLKYMNSDFVAWRHKVC